MFNRNHVENENNKKKKIGKNISIKRIKMPYFTK